MFPSKILLALIFSLAASLLARAQVSPFTIRVEADSKTSEEKSTKNVTRSLKIYLTNNAVAPSEVKVKYALFGRNVADHNVVLVSSGERPATLKPRIEELVETPGAMATEVERHYKAKVKVEAFGTKFVGYGVQVFQADKLVAETYDPISMKESWGKVPAAPPKAK